MSKQQSEIIYIAGWYNSRKYHTNKDCRKLQKADEIKAVSKHRYRTYELCAVCDPDVNEFKNHGREKGKECPYCGEIVNRFHAHLPCNE